MTATGSQLQRAIETLALPGILIDHRLIAQGDELALHSEELPSFSSSVLKVRRASGAGRRVARTLLARLGKQPQAIMKSAAGMPIWPPDIVGSIAHDSEIAMAAVAKERDFSSLGIDVEPARTLDPDLLKMVATARELERIDDDPYRGRLLFSVKEAVYKAAYPLDRVFLDHHDVEVDLPRGTAVVRNGRVVSFRYCLSSHIAVLAFVPASNRGK